MGIICFIAGIMLLRLAWKLSSANKRQQTVINVLAQKQAQTERKQESLAKEQMAQAKEQARLAKEQEQQAALLAKHEKRIADLENKVEQAQYDIDREIANLDYFNAKLSSLDEELEHARWEAENWKAQRHLANIAKAEKKAEKIQDSIFTWETKVRLAEKRLAKAQNTKKVAERELSAA